MRSLVQVQLGPLHSTVVQEEIHMKKLIPLVLVGLAALVLVRRQRSARAEADLWREATTFTS